MSATRTDSSGSAKWMASRNRSARPSSAEQAAARTPCRRSADGPRSPPPSSRSASARGDLRRVALEHDVDAVVLARVPGVEVDGDQRGRLRHREVLGLHAVEVGADGEHEVGLVPQRAGRLDVRRHADQARMRGREQPGGAVGGEDRRPEPLGQRGRPRRRRRARRCPPRSAGARRRRGAPPRRRARATGPSTGRTRSRRSAPRRRAGRWRPRGRPGGTAASARPPAPRRPRTPTSPAAMRPVRRPSPPARTSPPGRCVSCRMPR